MTLNEKIDAVCTNEKAFNAMSTLLAVENRTMTVIEVVELVYEAYFENNN